MSRRGRRTRRMLPLLAAGSIMLAACTADASRTTTPPSSSTLSSPATVVSLPPKDAPGNAREVTLAFAGDVHFQLNLMSLLDRPRGAFGPIERTLSSADLTMVNLESAITERGTPEAKELEVESERFWFRTTPDALDVLAAAGVDVVTMANNHSADYGPIGLEDTLAAIRAGPISVVGIGQDRRAAFTPYRVSIQGTDFALLGADASMREGASDVWAAGRTNPGLAAAHSPRPRALLAAVRAADRRDDVVIVYMHWGVEHMGCPSPQQRTMAQALADAGADVIVGSHAHALQGSGWLGSTYVDYGLGNFVWYQDNEPESGVLQLTFRDGQVVGDSWTPARIHTYGPALPLHGQDRVGALSDWRRLQLCTGLAAHRDEPPLPEYSWSMQSIGPALQHRMRSSHHPGCPVPLTDLVYLRMLYVGFDGRSHNGEMVVHTDYATRVATVFRRLYDARWPIRRMRLVDDYGGDDARSMAANNTSGFNCRRVAGSRGWSAHAYGAAIDINPVQNPDLTGTRVAPDGGRAFVKLDRSAGADPAPGVISARGPVRAAFERIGWEWGGTWSSGKDYQHFAVPDAWLETLTR